MHIGNISVHLTLHTVREGVYTTEKGGSRNVSRGFHSDDELREMEEHPGEMSRHIGRTKPYDCSYPQFAEKQRIAERSKDGEIDI